MNSSLKTFLRAGIIFGIFSGLIFSYLNGLFVGILAGIISGLLFGLFIVLFTTFQSKKFQMERPLFTDEKLIKEGPANHFLNKEGVGGWIYLTDKRFLFKSHSMNFQNHELSIPLSDINGVEKGRTFGIISNQLKLQLQNGQIEKFVVNDVGDWIKNIQ